MQELITKVDEYIDYTNDLTREMDKYLEHEIGSFRTYIYDHSLNGKTWAIRYPGATRGHIEINKDNTIVNIKLYKDCKTHEIYKPNVEECFRKYIGMKLIMV
jgi:hypothetical protein